MLKKKFSENVIQNAPNYTIIIQTFWRLVSNVPLNIVRSHTISLIFIKMNIFTIFFYKIVAKYTPERIKLPHFTKFSRGSMPPNPLAYKWLRHALHGTKRYIYMQILNYIHLFYVSAINNIIYYIYHLLLI